MFSKYLANTDQSARPLDGPSNAEPGRAEQCAPIAAAIAPEPTTGSCRDKTVGLAQPANRGKETTEQAPGDIAFDRNYPDQQRTAPRRDRRPVLVQIMGQPAGLKQ